jgi:hypothetical protein
LLLAACGQDNSYFHDPTPSNLGKSPPYDFATMKYPRDLSGVVPDDLTVTPDDLGGGDDLACLANQTCTIDASIPDLAKKPDLLSTDHPG